MPIQFRIESLLSARLFVAPQIVGDRLYFISDMSGRLTLYGMDAAGSIPEPLTPPDVALPNPHHMEDLVPYQVLPRMGKILLMLDKDGDENYQPVFLPIHGGYPEPVFGDRFAGMQVMCVACDPERNLALFSVDPRTNPNYQTYRADLSSRTLIDLGTSHYANFPAAHDTAFTSFVLSDQYTFGDVVLYTRGIDDGDRRLLYGTPMERRDGHVAPNGIGAVAMTLGHGLLFVSSLFEDSYGLTYMRLDNPHDLLPVPVVGITHTGHGELTGIHHRAEDLYTVHYNIDGCSWVYEGRLLEQERRFMIERVLCGEGELSNGVLSSLYYDITGDRYALSFSSATMPAQLYIIEEDGRLHKLTHERPLGIHHRQLSSGEDASYVSHDGLRVSARLYLPAPELGYTGKRPVIFYVHGGPQSQERPDYTWFSMPLIQYFTISGFAVWVPNVRGSSGYGLSYMKRVDRDWGGQDRLDHVHAWHHLRSDPRLDLDRAGVMGRSYGGYMTLTLAARHPELWKAACDMFGPYNLFTFIDRLPETWKTFFHQSVGHPEHDRAFLVERSPSSYIEQIQCPMLVLQGGNDPRVIEQESRDVVDRLSAIGKPVEYKVYEDEGHDVIKYVNKLDCYTRIVRFFSDYLKP